LTTINFDGNEKVRGVNNRNETAEQKFRLDECASYLRLIKAIRMVIYISKKQTHYARKQSQS